MLDADVVIAGGGIAGLLIASALAERASVVLIEQADDIPRNKYWLTDAAAATANPSLKTCVDCWYEFLDFVAYDGDTATVRGQYCLWHTDRLTGQLSADVARRGATVLTGHRLYSILEEGRAIVVRANDRVIRARLLIDCMGFGSPLVGAKDVADITGYYVLHGCEIATQGEVRPIALDNVILGRRPTYFEFFPTANQTAHAALILPSRHFRPDRSMKGDLHFILGKSHYAKFICDAASPLRSYFGIIPVGRLRHPALDRVVFFGEAGQTNPAASATALSRMLHTYRDLAAGIETCLDRDTLTRRDLVRAIPPGMTRMNRVFQESVFENLLSFNSDDFRDLVRDLRLCPDEIVNDLVFARFDFASARSIPLAVQAMLRPRSVLGRHVWRSLARSWAWRPSL